MIKNYFKTAWRSLVQNKIVSAISSAGLAMGIACFLLLATFVLNELRYDRFNVNAANIVRLVSKYKPAGDAEGKICAITPTAPVPVFKQSITGIADGARIYNYSNYKPATVKYNDKLFNEPKFLLADESFFKIFSFKFLEGDAFNAFSQLNTVVITSSIAKKYFGNEDPMGKILQVNSVHSMVVTGVIEDVPSYSQIKFDLMGNYAILDRSKTRQWDSANDFSYFLLKPGTDIHKTEVDINDYVDNIFKDDKQNPNKSSYALEPLLKIHLYSNATANLEPSGNIKYVYILSFVAIILLLLACVNFLNLFTAKSVERAHEIGVRKVMGAMRSQLFTQFIIEAAIITFISLIAGLGIAWLSFPWFSNFAGLNLGFQTWDTQLLILSLSGLFIGVTLIAGTYPSLYLSAFKPVTTLKGKSGNSTSGAFFRKSLVVFQFTVAVFFIICTIIAGTQLQYIRNMDTGINRSEVMMLDIGGMAFKTIQAFSNDLKQQQGVKNVTASYDSPLNVMGQYPINNVEGKGNLNLMVTAIPVERNFVGTLGIKLIAGNDFTLGDEQRVLDTNSDKRDYGFILNESAIKALGLTADGAIGKHIRMSGRQGEIRGVARDFNFASVHQQISPIVIFAEYDYFGKLLIRTSGTNVINTVSNIKQHWKSFYPNTPFEPHFLDQEYDKMYQTEIRTGNILSVFTMVTIFISCLGLLGLAIFSTKNRIREVGIRKVLGASVLNILSLISWDFLKLVVIAIIIASPLAYYAMNKWLQDFAYRIHIQWWVFFLAGGAAVLIAFATVSFQSIKAAIANPVKSLRSE